MSHLIHVSGIVDADAAERLVAQMTGPHPLTLDFNDVPAVHFAAMRKLLNARRSGRLFSIVNACDAVANRFADSGVSFYINVCRRAQPLDMANYEEFGASYLSKSYNSLDGDAMIKVYGPNVSRNMVAQEQAVARAVMRFGLPTPLVGAVYAEGERTGLDFERIHGKRSFSRIIEQEPERLEEISRRFARMCRQLHETSCDTAVFTDRALAHRQAIVICEGLTDAEREKILSFVDTIPAATTCLHGDMQMSNIITTGEEDLWIDLGEFGYGYPLLDVAMWYFLTRLNSEERAMQLFHLGLKELAQCWRIFADEYAGAHTEAEQQAFEQQVLPYAALHMIYIGVYYGFVPGMLDYAKSILLR